MLRKFFLILLTICLCFPTAFAQENDTVNTNNNNTVEDNAAYVLFKGDTIFSLNAYSGPFSPHQRATITNEKLAKLSNKAVDLDSFKIKEVNRYSSIYYSGTQILSIGEADLDSSYSSTQELAEEYVEIIQSAFYLSNEKLSTIDWIKRIGFTLLALVGLVIIFYLINRVFKWIDFKLKNYEKGLKRKRKSLFRYLVPTGPDYFFLFLSKVLKIVIIVLILFIYLPLLFSFLPWTKGLAGKFYEYIAEPVKFILNGFVNFLPNLFYIALILIIARYVLRILKFVASEIEEDKLKLKGFHKDWAQPTHNIVKVIVFAFTIVFMFPYIPGSDSSAFKGVSIFLGVLFSLGSTSAIANMVAGIVITYMRPFTIGDRVKIGETIGDVVEKNMLVTRIRTPKNEDVTIPNATIINTHLWNFSKYASELGIILHPTVTIGYDVPSDKVIELLLDAAKNTPNLTRDFKPFVLQKSLNDFYVEYELNVYTRQPSKMPLFYSELNKNILNEFNKAGIEILSPHYTSMRDGNKSTIPETATTADIRNPVTKLIDKATGIKE